MNTSGINVIGINEGTEVQELSPTGIASAESLGSTTARYNQDLILDGITSDEVVSGGSRFDLTFYPASVSSGEAFGLAFARKEPYLISPTGITSQEVIGTASATRLLKPTGITTQQAFGTAKLNLAIFLASAASSESFGSTRVTRLLKPTGIASAQAFGTASVNRNITCVGIGSTEAFGPITMRQFAPNLPLITIGPIV